jgi:hypothetical protein
VGIYHVPTNTEETDYGEGSTTQLQDARKTMQFVILTGEQPDFRASPEVLRGNRAQQ